MAFISGFNDTDYDGMYSNDDDYQIESEGDSQTESETIATYI